jgi:inner membrane protein
VYGTGLFEPFSDARIAWSSIFIIDPLYTLPFLGCIVAVFLSRDSRRRRTFNLCGLAISTAYSLFHARQ